jgi:hypothetical protein
MEISELLRKWNRDLLQDDSIADSVDRQFLDSKWLGNPAATEVQLEAAEARLGVRLPSSYREFLLIANGWAYPGNDMDFPGALCSIEQVAWFRDDDLAWINAWTVNAAKVSDEDYFVYGDDQDPVNLRAEYLNKCLKLSEVTEGGVYLLNPEIISNSYEWEAWHFSDELPGALRYKSFRDLIKYQHALFREMRDA